MNIHLTELEQGRLHSAIAEALNVSERPLGPRAVVCSAMAELFSRHANRLRAYLNVSAHLSAVLREIEADVFEVNVNGNEFIVPTDLVDSLYQKTSLSVPLLMRLNGVIVSDDHYKWGRTCEVSDAVVVTEEIIWSAFAAVDHFDWQTRVEADAACSKSALVFLMRCAA